MMGKPLARACVSCRSRKIKCDTQSPRCGACVAQGKDCIYRFEKPEPRPSRAIIQTLQSEKKELENKLREISRASPEDRNKLLRPYISDDESSTSISRSPSPGPSRHSTVPRTIRSTDEDSETEITNFVSVDESGKVGVYGLTSGLHTPSSPTSHASVIHLEAMSHQLIANALLQRQQEFYMSSYDFDGVPAELATHLLQLHWNRQHHSFLLTYRPAVMRDLAAGGGPYCSKLLLNAIFACVAKYSDRIELRTDPNDPRTAGFQFLQRVKELLPSEMESPSISLVVALLLLGSTLVSSGNTSTGWLYSGMAVRIVYDLGLHLDSRKSADLHNWTVEDMEIRRRVFWGAFICDKLQSLYLGRPVAIQCRDAHVPLEFLDTSEEEELWSPYRDTIEETHSRSPTKPSHFAAPVHSVSTFKHLCLLSKLMMRVINKFYVIGAERGISTKHKKNLLTIDKALEMWNENLPDHLRFDATTSSPCAPPNIMTLQAHYNCLIILLHRPFIADGHLRSSAGPQLTASSWQKCTAAAQRLTHLVSAYRTHLTLRRAPYQISYAVYVASTIHVRNAAQGNLESRDLLSFCLLCLRELSTPNVGTTIPERVIRRLMRSMGVVEEEFQDPSVGIPNNQSLPSPWSSFDLDAIVRSFPETPLQVRQPRFYSASPQGMMEKGQLWVEDTDVLFGLMGSQYQDFSTQFM